MSFTLLVGVVPADTFYRKMTVNAIPSGIVATSGAESRCTNRRALTSRCWSKYRASM